MQSVFPPARRFAATRGVVFEQQDIVIGPETSFFSVGWWVKNWICPLVESVQTSVVTWENG